MTHQFTLEANSTNTYSLQCYVALMTGVVSDNATSMLCITCELLKQNRMFARQQWWVLQL